MRGKLFVGTSGFAYKEWRPEFYPADLKDAHMLGFYASKLNSVEINYTFYREPSPSMLEGWAAKTPEDFAFALKANRKITHVRRLGDVDDVLERFLDAAGKLGSRLGPVLFQLPPTMPYDAETLDAFLARLPGGDMPNACRCAMEFRHSSFDSDEVREKLARADVAWCVSDTDERDAQMARTARSFVYLRLRKIEYGDDALKGWVARVDEMLDGGSDAYVYFKHEDTAAGAMYALSMREALGA
jgi:uncharacterized protein YecE (DUF72 family)